MPDFNDLFPEAPKNEPDEPQGIPIDGTFECQTCFEQVEQAIYDNVNTLLLWQCSNKHVSIIKDFKI